jgi:hypothetical protein
LRQEPTLGRYKTLNDFAKGYLETKALVSKKGVILPGPEAKPEQWNEVWTALGRPESPDKYDLTGFEAPKEGWDPELQKEALSTFHAAGMPPQMVKQVLGWYADRTRKEMESIGAKESELVNGWGKQLQQKFGSALEAKLDLADRTFETYFPGELGEAIAAARLPGGGPLAEYPGFVEAMATIGQLHAEHQLLGDKAPLHFAKTPDEAAAEIKKLKMDPEFAKIMGNRKHPDYEEKNALWLRLHQQAGDKA